MSSACAAAARAALPSDHARALTLTFDALDRPHPSYHTEITDFEQHSAIRNPPKEGVYVHGLFIDGAAWSVADSTVVESEPKKLYGTVPALWMTAVTKAQKKGKSGDYGPFGPYEAPLYKYPARGDRYLVITVQLPTREHKPSHWTLRGVALLCTSD